MANRSEVAQLASDTNDALMTPIAGCRFFRFGRFKDDRGYFAKPFATPFLEGLGIDFRVAETFFSESSAGVLRGMHFQVPPHDHNKIVVCLGGRVLDLVLDLRIGSSTFGKTFACELSADEPLALFIPKGLAHGFYTLSDSSLMAYWVDAPYSKEHDLGIRWNSVGFSWPHPAPVISARDLTFPAFSEFDSPFRL